MKNQCNKISLRPDQQIRLQKIAEELNISIDQMTQNAIDIFLLEQSEEYPMLEKLLDEIIKTNEKSLKTIDETCKTLERTSRSLRSHQRI